MKLLDLSSLSYSTFRTSGTLTPVLLHGFLTCYTVPQKQQLSKSKPLCNWHCFRTALSLLCLAMGNKTFNFPPPIKNTWMGHCMVQ